MIGGNLSKILLTLAAAIIIINLNSYYTGGDMQIW